MTTEQSKFPNDIERSTVRMISKLALGIGGLLVLLYLLALLPGTDRVLPITGATITAIITAVIALAVVALLIYLAGGLASLTTMLLSGPREIVEHLGSIVYWLVILVAVIVAHWGLSLLAGAMLGDWIWVVDVLFLVAALPVLILIAVRMYVSLDPAADLIADTVVGSSEEQG